jgi:MFS transporter, DHA1 family, inner membrane transport protein
VFDKRYAIGALTFGNFIVGLCILLPTGMLVDLSQGLSVSVGTAGLMISLGAGVVCLSPPFVTWITSRMDRRTLLGAIVLWLALGHMVSTFAPSYSILLATRVAMLSFAGAFTPLAASTIANLVPEQQRASSVSTVLLGWAIAIAFGLPMVTVIVPHVGWRATYALTGILATAGFLSILVGLPKGIKGTPINFATWRSVFVNGNLILLLSITMFLAAGQLVLVAFVGPLLSASTGASPRDIALVFLVFGLMTLVGNVAATRLVKTWSAFRTSAVFATFVLAGVTIWTAGTGSYALMAAGAATWGLGFAAVSAMQQARLIAAAPHLATASVAINNTVLYFGQALGSGIGSVIFARGNFNGMGYAAIALVTVALGLVWLSRNILETFGGAMDSDTIQLLARAFDQALEQHRLTTPAIENEKSLRAELARCIVATARTGERDESVLARHGYLTLQLLQPERTDG